MARRVILDTQYTFNPATRTIVIPRIIPRERILLITNTTNNTVIYNFSDPVLGLTSYNRTLATENNTNPVTTLVLAYNTTSMGASDTLQITIDEVSETFSPDESLTDPVSKFRVSEPQALIDTDFEYGLQPTKWETLTLLNNRPSFFVNTQQPLTMTNISATQGFANVLVTLAAGTTRPANGTPVLIQDSTFGPGNGPVLVDLDFPATNSFQYTSRVPYTGPTGSIFNSTLTQAYQGTFYSNAQIQATSLSFVGNTVYVVTTIPHGLYLGNGIYVANSLSQNVNGSWQVAAVTNSTAFHFVVNSNPTVALSAGTLFYPRPDGVYTHRAWDGGVTFTTGTNSHTAQTIRQTRRYFRYQSGKGLQISTGTILKPNINIDEVAASGNVVTVTTKFPHYLQPGVSINLSGSTDLAYNANTVIDSILNPFQFTYKVPVAPANTIASGVPTLSVLNWNGASVRVGIFDQQNGLFFEFDGQQIWAVRRRSTDQLAGYVNVTNGSTTVQGVFNNTVTTKFSKQLVPGDFVVIKGMSYRVMSIQSDTQMTINPPYRGNTLSGVSQAIVNKTTEMRIPQSQWNIDRMDGNGPSGSFLDLSKMQMFYIDYSWYGAGTVRFGFRDTTGKVFYVHRMVNSNINTEAYMRSGNLPARYEATTFSPMTLMTSNITASDTTMFVANTQLFPSTGTLFIENPNSYEFVSYTSKTANSFSGLTRGKLTVSVVVNTTANSANLTTGSSVSGLQPGMMVHGQGIPNQTYISSIGVGGTSNIVLTQAATVTGTGVSINFNQMGSFANIHSSNPQNPIGVSLHSPSFSPVISHWGTSVMMDGKYDDDKSLVFTYGEPALTTVQPGNTVALCSLRVSPSVDNGITGALGQKDVINRMQLKLVSLGVLTQGQFLMSVILNGTVTNTHTAGVATNGAFANTFGAVAPGTSSLAQIADHIGNTQILAGESVISFYATNSAGATNFSTERQDLTQIRDLGNSILGGGTSNSVSTGVYPDGPDIVTVTARNIGTVAANVQVRLSWTEAQA